MPVESRNASVLLIGGGRIGGALLEGWRDTGLLMDDFWVVEPNREARFKLKFKKVVSNITELPLKFKPDIIVFAVKQNVIKSIIKNCQIFSHKTIYISVIAGKTISWFTSILGFNTAIVRAMPNIPTIVKRGITVACSNAVLDTDGYALCTNLLEAVGNVVWIQDEQLLDAVTAVSGSGPAYVFLLTESLAQAGRAAGLPADLAERLARVTVAGTGELLSHSTDSAAALRQQVTSPGGTTAAALAVLMDEKKGLEFLLTRAVSAATLRSCELSRDCS